MRRSANTLWTASWITLIVGLASVPQTAWAKSLGSGTSSELTRVRHARELLGKFYQNSKVHSAGENSEELRQFVLDWVDQALASKDRGRWKKQSARLAQTIITESQRYGLDPVLLIAVIESESSFSPMAQGKAGEIGLMQIMPSTAKWISKRFQLKWTGRRSLYDPTTNVRIGAAYLAYLRAEFDFEGNNYLSAYNMGSSRLRRTLANQGPPKLYASKVKERYLHVYSEFSKR